MPVLSAASYDTLPGWAAEHPAAILPGLLAQCRRLAQMPSDMKLGGAGMAAVYGGKAGQWAPACAAARASGAGDAAVRGMIAAWFQPYRVESAALVTGYFEPELRGALQRGGVYQTPVLGRPSDLIEVGPPQGDPEGKPVIGRRVGGALVPYWTRADIEAGRAGAAARPILFLADPIDLAFLQIQGAGRVVLPDGHVVRLGFAGSNGRAYTPIGRVLIARHALLPEAVTMQSIRAWLVAHPDQVKSVLDANDRYVFLRLVDDESGAPGPVGALGVDLVPGRAAAVDPHFTPLGSLMVLDTTDPLSRAPWRVLVLAQDLGSDIAGPARVDLFVGAGDAAAARAGAMRQGGTVYLLLPRPPAGKPVG